MSVGKIESSETRSTRVRTLARFGSVLGVFAMLVLLSGCPPMVPCSSDAECDDGNACNGDETCVSSMCTSGTAMVCDDNNLCTEDSCADSVCVFTATAAADACDASDLCNPEVCNPDNGDCEVTPTCTADQMCDPADGSCTDTCVDDTDCDDGDVCNGTETCGSDGLCVAGMALDCDDGLVCTDDSCSPTSGCANTAVICPTVGQTCSEPGGCAACVADSDCDDSVACTDDACVSGSCTNTDNCTVTGETCNLTSGLCEAATAGACTTNADCADGVFCNGDEICDSTGTCVDGPDPCTSAQTCDETNQTCSSSASLVLTTGADSLLGTAGDDAFTGGLVNSAGTDQTLGVTDTLDGGGGTGDSLGVALLTNYTGLAIINRIEQFFVRNATGGSLDFSVIGIGDVGPGDLQLWTDTSSSPLVFKDMDQSATIGVRNTDDDVTATFNNTVFAGTSDTANVALDGSKDTDTTDGVDVIIGSTGADGPETIFIDSRGSVANGLDSISDAGENDTKTLVITGSQDLAIDGIDATGNHIETLDASGFTGNLTANVSADNPANGLDVTGGSGDDTINFGNTFDVLGTGADSFDGGGGTNTVVITPTAGGFGLAPNWTNVQNLRIDDFNTAASLNMDGMTLDTLFIEDGDTTLVQYTLTALPSQPGTIEFRGDGLGSTGASQQFNGVNTVLKVDTATDAIVVNVGNRGVDLGSGNSYSMDQIDSNSAETVTLNFKDMGADGSVSFANQSDLKQMTSLTVTTSSGAANAVNNVVLGTIDTGATDTVVNVNATGVSGRFGSTATPVVINDLASGATVLLGNGKDTVTLNTGSGTGFTVNAGGGDDTIIGPDGTSVINGEAGDDTLTGGTGIDTITGGSGDDIIVGAANNDVLTGGSGNDTLTGGPGADIITGSGGADIFTVVTETDSLNTSMDTFMDFASGSDKLDVATPPTALGSGNVGPDLNTATVASTGTTAATLATDIGTAVAAAGANVYDQAGDTLVVTLTGASIGGTAAVYVVIEDGSTLTTYEAAEDAVILLGGTSSTVLALGDFQ